MAILLLLLKTTTHFESLFGPLNFEEKTVSIQFFVMFLGTDVEGRERQEP